MIIRILLNFKKQDVEEWLKKAEEFINIVDKLALEVIEKKDE